MSTVEAMKNEVNQAKVDLSEYAIQQVNRIHQTFHVVFGMLTLLVAAIGFYISYGLFSQLESADMNFQKYEEKINGSIKNLEDKGKKAELRFEDILRQAEADINKTIAASIQSNVSSTSDVLVQKAAVSLINEATLTGTEVNIQFMKAISEAISSYITESEFIHDEVEQTFKRALESNEMLKKALQDLTRDQIGQIKDAIAAQNELLGKRVESQVQDAMTGMLTTLKGAASEEPKTSEDAAMIQKVAEKTIDRTNEGLYWVVVASSTKGYVCESEVQRWKRNREELRPEKIPGRNICKVVLGGKKGLPYDQAKELRALAIESGFRDDSFVMNVNN